MTLCILCYSYKLNFLQIPIAPRDGVTYETIIFDVEENQVLVQAEKQQRKDLISCHSWIAFLRHKEAVLLML